MNRQTILEIEVYFKYEKNLNQQRRHVEKGTWETGEGDVVSKLIADINTSKNHFRSERKICENLPADIILLWNTIKQTLRQMKK